MSGIGRTDYQATYRATEAALPGLLGLLAVFAGGIFVAFKVGDGDLIIKATLWLAAFTVAGALGILIGCFRIHRWSVGPEGVEIVERPKVPLAGPSRRAAIAFADIAALARVESGLDRLIEIVTRDGRRFRMPQVVRTTPNGLGVPDFAADLEAFAVSLRAAAEQAGHPLPATSEALSFWNTAGGVACLVVMFLVSLAIAAAVGWALLDGGLKPQPRGGQASAILILLPVGAGWLLLKALRRRKAVLARARG